MVFFSRKRSNRWFLFCCIKLELSWITEIFLVKLSSIQRRDIKVDGTCLPFVKPSCCSHNSSPPIQITWLYIGRRNIKHLSSSVWGERLGNPTHNCSCLNSRVATVLWSAGFVDSTKNMFYPCRWGSVRRVIEVIIMFWLYLTLFSTGVFSASDYLVQSMFSFAFLLDHFAKHLWILLLTCCSHLALFLSKWAC